MTTISAVIHVLAVMATGLMAGLFFAYACSVMPGLRRAGDAAFIEAMVHINAAIRNVWFGTAFFGALASTGAALAIDVATGSRAAWLTATALALYVLVLATTFAFNIPLNHELERSGQASPTAGGAVRRHRFEARWVRWNRGRTVAAAGAFAAACAALLQAADIP